MQEIRLGCIDCRVVGPGGTSIDFYATPKGIKCVWENENCPYEDADPEENVSWLTWSEVQSWIKKGLKKKWIFE